MLSGARWCGMRKQQLGSWLSVQTTAFKMTCRSYWTAVALMRAGNRSYQGADPSTVSSCPATVWRSWGAAGTASACRRGGRWTSCLKQLYSYNRTTNLVPHLLRQDGEAGRRLAQHPHADVGGRWTSCLWQSCSCNRTTNLAPSSFAAGWRSWAAAGTASACRRGGRWTSCL